MTPRWWRWTISGTLRVFLSLTAPLAAHPGLLAWLVSFVIAFLVPPPASWQAFGRARDASQARGTGSPAARS
ncbi:hypothetical protein [Amycolatopsis benzoatilytica]|uniref:hypothetical protein n=1 Tax=Amycolatopsis benzoatilytica TaxID=346045 RepID=UPI0003A22430|nr:hypothetical protein [Amycolatopsis benzoatilytica]